MMMIIMLIRNDSLHLPYLDQGGLGCGAEDLELLIAAIIADLKRLNVIHLLIHVITWL
jgi:hypothetical protein